MLLTKVFENEYLENQAGLIVIYDGISSLSLDCLSVNIVNILNWSIMRVCYSKFRNHLGVFVFNPLKYR